MNSFASERRVRTLLGAALYALSLVVLLGYSARTGPAFDELSRLEAVERAASIVRAVADGGFSELGHPASTATLGSLEGQGVLPILAGAWAELSIGRVGLLDPLTAARLPWLLVAALCPALVFALVAPSRGSVVGVVAGLLLLAQPRFCHAAAVTAEAVTRVAVWLAVLALSQRALSSHGRAALAWSLSAATALGAGAALTLGALWVVPLAVLHHWAARASSLRRLLPRGRLPLPAFAVMSVVTVPALVIAFTPPLWTANVVRISRWLLAPLAPSMAPAPFAGRVVSDLPMPLGFMPGWLVMTVPAATLVCALVGLGVISERALARRFAHGRLRPPRDRTALGSLIVLGLVVTVIGPAWLPPALATFPPLAETALPFVAIAAGLGLDAAARVALPRRPVLPMSIVLAALAWLTLQRPATSAAAFDVLLGGAKRVAREKLLPVGDGSELSALVPAIEALGPEQVTIAAHEVPRELWSVLAKRRRVGVRVVAGGGGLELVRGGAPRDGIAQATREGAVLWTLRRGR